MVVNFFVQQQRLPCQRSCCLFCDRRRHYVATTCVVVVVTPAACRLACQGLRPPAVSSTRAIMVITPEDCPCTGAPPPSPQPQRR